MTFEYPLFAIGANEGSWEKRRGEFIVKLWVINGTRDLVHLDFSRCRPKNCIYHLVGISMICDRKNGKAEKLQPLDYEGVPLAHAT